MGCFFKQVNVLALLHKVVIGSPALFPLREFSSDWGLFGRHARPVCNLKETPLQRRRYVFPTDQASQFFDFQRRLPALLNPALIQGRVSSSRLLSNMPGPKVFKYLTNKPASLILQKSLLAATLALTQLYSRLKPFVNSPARTPSSLLWTPHKSPSLSQNKFETSLRQCSCI